MLNRFQKKFSSSLVVVLTCLSFVYPIPVYAAEPKEKPVEVKPPVVQTLNISQKNWAKPKLDRGGVEVVEDPQVVAQREENEREAAEEKQASEAAQNSIGGVSSTIRSVESLDVPAILSKASSQETARLVQAALAQVGTTQDCTDLVQNSLAALGLITRRDKGGFDLGTALTTYLAFGEEVNLDSLKPGDILIYGHASDGAHVSVYLGKGLAVHGGWNGNQTVVASMSADLPLTGAVRLSD